MAKSVTHFAWCSHLKQVLMDTTLTSFSRFRDSFPELDDRIFTSHFSMEEPSTLIDGIIKSNSQLFPIQGTHYDLMNQQSCAFSSTLIVTDLQSQIADVMQTQSKKEKSSPVSTSQPEKKQKRSLSRTLSPIVEVETAKEIPSANSLFTLVRQPELKQRKCYSGEKRFVQPNPFTIVFDEKPNIAIPTDCFATVDLLEDDHQISIEGIIGESTPTYMSTDGQIQIPVKILSPRLNHRFRLGFNIKYRWKSTEEYNEVKMVTNAFVISSRGRREKIGRTNRSPANDLD